MLYFPCLSKTYMEGLRLLTLKRSQNSIYFKALMQYVHVMCNSVYSTCKAVDLQLLVPHRPGRMDFGGVHHFKLLINEGSRLTRWLCLLPECARLCQRIAPRLLEGRHWGDHIAQLPILISCSALETPCCCSDGRNAHGA